MKPPSLTETDRQAAWRLLLPAYAASRELSDRGFALCRRQFGEQAEADPMLVRVLGREYLRRKVQDRHAREVYALLGQADDPEASAARRGLVRCDARLRNYDPQRLPWYRQALAENSNSAAFLLTYGVLEAGLDEPELGAQALRRALLEDNARAWQAFGLNRDAAVLWLARWQLTQPASADGLLVVDAARQLQPDQPEFLKYLAEFYRPSLDEGPRRIYEALFNVAPDELGNTGFLAQQVLAGRLQSPLGCAILAAWRPHAEGDEALELALACETVRLERDDDDALEWLRHATAQPGAPAQLLGWLTVCELRHGGGSPELLVRAREVVADEALPPAWRSELGLAIAQRAVATGEADETLLEATWNALESGERPDWLTTALAELYAAGERVGPNTVEVYRQIGQLDPKPNYDRLLGRAYLTDTETPTRDKIAHWRVCLDQGQADAEMMTALAKAYAAEGSATEAALQVVGNMPEAQRPRVLDELCGYRFRRHDFGSAETLAGALVQLRPDDPDAVFKLLLCRVRRVLASGGSLEELDLSAAGAHAAEPRLRSLLQLVDTLLGHGSDEELVTALERLGSDVAALGAVAAVLAGEEVATADLPAGTSEEQWVLAAIEHVEGDLASARRRLQSVDEPDLRLWERLLAARQATLAGGGEQAYRLMAPLSRQRGAPWDSWRPALAELAVRYAPSETVEQFGGLLDLNQQFALDLRTAATLADDLPADALRALHAIDAELEPATWRALHDAILAAMVKAELAAGDRDAADAHLAGLRDAEDVPAQVIWLSAVVAADRNDLEAALAHAYRLSEEVRSHPGVAWIVADWFRRNQQDRMAEAALSLALARHPDEVELRLAVAAMEAQLGRGSAFVKVITPILELMGQDDPRREGLELLCDAFGSSLAEVDLDALLDGVERMAPETVTLRLRVVHAAAAARLRSRQPASVRDALAKHLPRLARVTLPRTTAPVIAELQNALAYAQFLLGQHEAATEQLRAIRPRPPAAYHNLAVVAEAAEQIETAAQRHEQALDGWTDESFEQVSSTYREAVTFALHKHVAGLYRSVENWTDELRHLDDCVETRPYDFEVQRAAIQPLIALGDTDRALHKSNWLLRERPQELDLQLDHAYVIASAKGATDAIEFLDQLVAERPEAVDVVRERKLELRQRLIQLARERARAKDYRALFAVARDVEMLGGTDEEKAQALLQQSLALVHLAAETEPVARLEQALAKAEAALALPASGALGAQATALIERARKALGPHLAQQADGLFLHRRKAYHTLAEQSPPPADGAQQAKLLAEAFERVVALFERAIANGDDGLLVGVQGRLQEARDLSVKCRELGQRLGGAG